MPNIAQSCPHVNANELPVISAITPLCSPQFLRQREVVNIYEKPIALLQQSPGVFADYVIAHLRKSPVLDRASRQKALQQAGELFAGSVLCGMNLTEYNTKVSSLTGLPRTVVENASDKIAQSISHALTFALKGIPYGVPLQENQATDRYFCAQSVRRGDVLTVIAPGNGTGVHALWPQAIALGYRVVIRPSEREPFTAQRVVAAMVAAGLQDYVTLLPCNYDVVETLIDAADLSLIYGADEITARYADRRNILVQGPGRSKVVIGADYPLEKALELIFTSVVGLGGAACVCASSVLVEGDAEALARKFCAFLSNKMKDPKQREEWLTHFSPQRYSWWCGQVDNYASALVETPEVFKSTQNTYQVMPLVMQASAINDPLVQLELPVAAVTFLSFKEGDNLDFLAPALVVTVASGNKNLINAIANVPGVKNFYIGQVPTVWMHPDVPHDGYLAEFLMQTRGYCVNNSEDEHSKVT
ncbi:aldehyde dehydrogenase family protein [Pantoea agglomerans]|uniref:aldehyde dehydrogenase family protein n=1 Tax=Enterobacter agglomerans TaxID=549 RepID=UPI0013024A3E|nr:aldehyde dehydrogenase family protein [Pantoea agglomerans]QGY60581.1 aldehyde dehydrogenase family protein [Pantoea agglomerans]WRO92311.1 aldehyde dehydrogenase family protein [Pantoea agglomerans]